MLAILALLALAACGGTDDETGAASAAPTASPLAGDGGAVPGGAPPSETDQGPDGGPDDNIVDGDDVDVEDYPWVVALRRPGAVDDPSTPGFDESDNFCGGALVAEGAVMTAAHCVTTKRPGGTYTLTPPSTIEVVLGRSDLDDASTGQVVQVARVLTVQGFDPVSLDNDFAVLELASNVDQAPIALASISQSELWTVGKDTLTLGWGCEAGLPLGPDDCGEREGNSPLRAAWLDVQARDVCKAFGTIDTHLCMKSPDDSAGICQGDSGGPWAVYDASGKPFLIGITSFNALNGECQSSIPQGAAFVPLVTTADRWFTPNIWDPCQGTEPCPPA